MVHSLTGTRIRQQRTRIGLSQTALARQAGISTSYLNLIEHNKRGIAGKVLLSLARELGVPAQSLTDDTDSGLTTALQEAAAYLPKEAPETASLTEFAGRFPGWSRLLAAVFRQTQDQDTAIAELSDRLAHDPFLAESLHIMLSNITAIRSTAEILRSVEDIGTDQTSRFHGAIHDESKRLSEAAQALIDYFEKDIGENARTATPEEELEKFLSKHDYRFPSLDLPDADADEIDVLLIEAARSMSAPTRKLARRMMQTYLDDTKIMPLSAFAVSALAADYNPSALAAEFQTNLHAVFRRLAGLKRDGVAAPTIGLQIVNAAGHALLRHPLTDFPLPRHGNACPLWPIYQSFTQPERPLLEWIELPSGKQFVALAVALPRETKAFDVPPDYRAAMLVIPKDQARSFAPWLSNTQAVRQVGTSCRICPRENCPARCEATVF